MAQSPSRSDFEYCSGKGAKILISSEKRDNLLGPNIQRASLLHLGPIPPIPEIVRIQPPRDQFKVKAFSMGAPKSLQVSGPVRD